MVLHINKHDFLIVGTSIYKLSLLLNLFLTYVRPKERAEPNGTKKELTVITG